MDAPSPPAQRAAESERQRRQQRPQRERQRPLHDEVLQEAEEEDDHHAQGYQGGNHGVQGLAARCVFNPFSVSAQRLPARADRRAVPPRPEWYSLHSDRELPLRTVRALQVIFNPINFAQLDFCFWGAY
mgnify:CR=1 FL=1